MLRSADGEQGRNFLTPEIFAVAKKRLAESSGAVEQFRLLHNLLSSQPMCFNLFGPLVNDLDLATRLWQALLPQEIAQVTHVKMEYAPQPASEYLNDRTAFDAFVTYRRPDGSAAFLGIETKLTETFSPKMYDGPRYRRFTEGDASPWKAEAGHQLADRRWNQLWRDHMLVEAIRRRQGAPHGVDGKLIVVRHPGDVPCKKIVDHYRSLLVDPADSFIDLPLDTVVDTWSAVLREQERVWLDTFRARYLDLSLSEAAWRQHRSSKHKGIQ